MRLETWFRIGTATAFASGVAQRLRRMPLRGKVVLISGGSRGLGLAMARVFSDRGARLALCARDADELRRVEAEFRKAGRSCWIHACDVSDPHAAQRFVDHAWQRFGRIDVLVNDAGVIHVGPAQELGAADVARVMDVNFWGAVHLAKAAWPRLAETKGRVVNITSIGGVIPVPHLLSYNAAKHALVGWSETLGIERPDGVRVTTVIPGLMRTGSAGEARVTGRRAKEAQWFGVAQSLPFVTMSAARAARRIVRACERGRSVLVLGLPARMGRLAYALAPGLTMALLRAVHRLALPAPTGETASAPPSPARDFRTGFNRSPYTTLNDAAGRDLNERIPDDAPRH